MVCPRCATILDDDCDKCFNCSMEFKHSDETADVQSDVSAKKELSPEKKKKILIIKIVAIAVAAVVLIIGGFVAFKIFTTPNGQKIAAKLGDKVGESIVVAEKNANIHVVEKSQSAAINKQKDFDYIYESADIIKVDGVKVPKWTIKVVMKDNQVFSVYYRNYADQKSYYKGKKLDCEVNPADINIGMNASEAVKKFNISPVSITYYDNQTDYCYIYYTVNADKDEERHGIILSFDGDMKVQKVTVLELSKFNNNYF